MTSQGKLTMAMLLSMSSFEGFYGGVMRLTREEYLRSYRNDFSFVYAYALARQDVDVVIYLPSFGPSALHTIDSGVSVRFLHIGGLYALWRKFPILHKTPYGRYAAQVANTMAFEQELLAGLRADGVDVLYVQEYWTGRFDYLTGRMPVPVIGSDHGGRSHRQLTFRKRTSFRQAAAITCQTENECESVRSFGGEPTLLPNGIDTEFFTSGERSASRPKNILIVARLNEHQKRITDLIQSLQSLPEEWTLDIAGIGPDEGLLRARAEEMGVSSRVHFLGFVSGRDHLRGLYRNCGVFCMCSAAEAVALAMLEAMSCECACVGTDIRGFAILENGVTGYKVPVGSPGALAKAIQRAYEEREALGPSARQLVQNEYSVQSLAASLKSLFLRSVSGE